MWHTPAYRRISPPEAGQQATSIVSNCSAAAQAATSSSDMSGKAAVSSPIFISSHLQGLVPTGASLRHRGPASAPDLFHLEAQDLAHQLEAGQVVAGAQYGVVGG